MPGSLLHTAGPEPTAEEIAEYEELRRRVRSVVELGVEQVLDSDELVGIVEPMLRESLDEY